VTKNALFRHPPSAIRHQAAAVLAAALICSAAAAQPYPSRPIRMIAATSAGGITDHLARVAAANLTQALGQNVIVDNRPGATGTVAVDLVSKAAPDGYTLLTVAGGNIVITPFLYRSLAVDPVNALAPVFNIAGAPQLLVVTGALPVKDLREFVALAKAKPGSVNYASAGLGSTTHLAADHFARLTGVELVHVPYKGVGPALADLIAGRVQMLSVGLGPVQSHLKSGALKALTVASKRRLDALPDLPTSAEAGVPGYEMTTWFGVFAPKATSPKIIQLLNARLQAVIDDPKIRKGLLDSGIEPIGGSVKTFTEVVSADYKAWGEVVRASGVKLE
jgi:tripartite-type tricarboxylate transporter receptor subunit TctC